MAPGEKLFRLIEKIDAAINCAEIKIDEINFAKVFKSYIFEFPQLFVITIISLNVILVCHNLIINNILFLLFSNLMLNRA